MRNSNNGLQAIIIYLNPGQNQNRTKSNPAKIPPFLHTRPNSTFLNKFLDKIPPFHVNIIIIILFNVYTLIILSHYFSLNNYARYLVLMSHIKYMIAIENIMYTNQPWSGQTWTLWTGRDVKSTLKEGKLI